MDEMILVGKGWRKKQIIVLIDYTEIIGLMTLKYHFILSLIFVVTGLVLVLEYEIFFGCTCDICL